VRLPSAIQRRTWARRLLVVWAQVFVVLPAMHLHDHADDHHHAGGGIVWHGSDAHYPHAEELPHSHAAPDHDAEEPSAEHPDHDAEGAPAHLSAAILPTIPQLLRLFRTGPIQGPDLRPSQAPPAGYAGFTWAARAPPA
jgi:hypothetical protein